MSCFGSRAKTRDLPCLPTYYPASHLIKVDQVDSAVFMHTTDSTPNRPKHPKIVGEAQSKRDFSNGRSTTRSRDVWLWWRCREKERIILDESPG